jgi:cell division protease FtsH
MVLLGLYLVATLVALPTSPGHRLRYDEFLTDLRRGEIQSATIRVVDHRIAGTYAGGQYWLGFGADDINPVFANLVTAIQQSGVPLAVDNQWIKALVSGPQFSLLLPSLVLVDALALVFLLVQGGGLLGFGRSGSRRMRTGESRICFADVAGVDEAVEELAEIRDFLADPERFSAMGARIPRGILLAGPPGCGKTLLARAVAGEAEAQFFSVSGSAFVEMYVGVGAARIRDLFREAQEAAPSIVFIDELDAVGRGRTASAAGGQDERESTLNQLLVGLDGFDTDAGVVVMAATNRPDVLDPALLRPGRFDRRITVDLPDVGGRLAILGVHVRGKPMAPDTSLDLLARRTPGFSGADLASVVNEAALLAARRGDSVVTDSLLWEAVERLVAGPERRSKLLGPVEKRLIAYHEAGHALVSASVNPHQRVTKISLTARGHGLGFTWYDSDSESRVVARDHLMDRLSTMLGGRAAEELACGQPTSGAEDDLARATELARRMVCEMGMSEVLGPVSLKATAVTLMSSTPSSPSPELAGLVDHEVRALVVEARQVAREAIEAHRDRLDALAQRLQHRESIEGPELDALLYPDGLTFAHAGPELIAPIDGREA